ncbi:MAG: transcription-repair coupling factor, partial [Hyphomicrobium sp.]
MIRDKVICGVPEGYEGIVLSELCINKENKNQFLLHIARDDRRLDELERSLKFFSPSIQIISFPAWDTVPYDRIGPNPEIVSKRISSLTKLLYGQRKSPTILIVTVNAILQKIPPREFIKKSCTLISSSQSLNMEAFIKKLVNSGYSRTSTVMEQGEFAVRGGIIDLYSPGRSSPVRLDFFGNTIE